MLLGGPQNTIKSHLLFTALFCFAPLSVLSSRMSAPYCLTTFFDNFLTIFCTFFDKFCLTTIFTFQFLNHPHNLCHCDTFVTPNDFNS
jgi:hypothetical protein